MSGPTKTSVMTSRSDAAGNAYVTGATNSIGHWHADAYVAKFDPSGSRLLYTTYLDGDGWDDVGAAIAVDAAGNAYVTGALENLGAFVAKLDRQWRPALLPLLRRRPWLDAWTLA